MAFKSPFIFTALFLVCVVMTHNVDRENKGYNDLASNRGLYSTDTKVIVLNATDFKKNVYGATNAWLVEFYNSWCGFCQRFAPTWISLAADLYGWKDIIQIAALDCAVDDNNPLCREYEIMHYPSLKFFSSHSKPTVLGTEVDKGKNVEEIRHTIVELLKKEQLENRGSNWPNITPYRSSDVQNLWKNVPETIKYSFLVFEEKDSHVGSEVILDLHHIKNIQIRRVINENEALFKLMGVIRYPSMVVLERNQNTIPIKIRENTRESFCNEIRSFLRSHNIVLPLDKIDNEKKLTQEDSNINVQAPSPNDDNAVQQFGDVVFQVDLENTLQYSLKSEIPVRKYITSQSLDALKKYLSVLAKYFPIGPRGTEFLEKLRDRIQDLNTVKGQMFLEIVESLETEMKPVFPSSEGWLGCKGSARGYRGYPCGLWTTFHTLTTNAVIQNGGDKNFNNLEVLEAMLGYITHFFGCQDCSQNFQEMAMKSMRQNVTNPDESILWLWSAHNMVNKRLAGDMTEDPQHPKIQFPSIKTCPACHSPNGQWVLSQVLAYLKQMYSKHSVVHMDLDSKPVPQQEKLQGVQTQNKVIYSFNSSQIIDRVERRKVGWNFNIFDISLCVILYAGSAVILILVFIKFIVRKRYRKKTYIHDILGKV